MKNKLLKGASLCLVLAGIFFAFTGCKDENKENSDTGADQSTQNVESTYTAGSTAGGVFGVDFEDIFG